MRFTERPTRIYVHELYYPFHIFYNNGHSEHLVYHFPSGNLQKIPGGNIMNIGHKGQLAFVGLTIGSGDERQLFVQAVHHPFDPSQRRILLKINLYWS